MTWPTIQRADLAKYSKILVVDDDEFEYVSLFERDGYTITKWDDVEDRTRLESGEFHVILLDLHGIGSEISSDEGAGVISHIKKVNPAQVVVAYTAGRHGFSIQQFICLLYTSPSPRDRG